MITDALTEQVPKIDSLLFNLNCWLLVVIYAFMYIIFFKFKALILINIYVVLSLPQSRLWMPFYELNLHSIHISEKVLNIHYKLITQYLSDIEKEYNFNNLRRIETSGWCIQMTLKLMFNYLIQGSLQTPLFIIPELNINFCKTNFSYGTK